MVVFSCLKRHWRRAWCWPVEVRVAAFFGAVLAMGLALGLPANLPDRPSLEFVHRHFFSPLLLAFLLQSCLPLALGRRRRIDDPLLMLKLFPFMVLVVFMHFNLKAWMPLVNPQLHDEFFHRTDQTVWPIVTFLGRVRQVVADSLPVDMDPAYHCLFLGIFFVSVSAHAVLDSSRGQRQLVLGLSLILLVGGLLYWVMPAVGPFLFQESLNAHSHRAQMHMLKMFAQVYDTHRLPQGYFTAPLAAMPSLHVAHALFFTLLAYQRVRGLFYLLLPCLLWFLVESVASGWHYVIDIGFGAGLAVYCLRLTQRLLPEQAGDLEGPHLRAEPDATRLIPALATRS